jgi:hypothetical protein
MVFKKKAKVEVLDIENMKGYKLVVVNGDKYIIPDKEIKNFIGGVNGNIRNKGKEVNKGNL